MSDVQAGVLIAPQGTLPLCQHCRGSLERVRRSGFLQERILPLFTRYPWRCVLCDDITYRTARNRGELRWKYGASR